MGTIERAGEELPLAQSGKTGTVEESLMETGGPFTDPFLDLHGKLRKQLAQGNTEYGGTSKRSLQSGGALAVFYPGDMGRTLEAEKVR